MKVSVTKKPGCEAVIEGVIPVADIQKEFGVAVDRVVKNIELPGFRKGKAPKERVLQEVGEKGIWREAAEDALRDQLADILKEHTLAPIIAPSIMLTIREPQTDVPFTVTVITQPTLEIKDYKKTTEESLKKLEKLDREKEKENARKSLNMQAAAMVRAPEAAASEAPFTDEEAKKLGFADVPALETLLDSEADRAVDNYDQQRKRGAVAESLLASATFDVPDIIVRDEVAGMLDSTKQDIARQGMPWNEYLKRSGKSEEQIASELLPAAKKRVALDMIFAKIAHEEKIKPDEEEVHKVAHALMHQGAEEQQAHQYGAEVSLREKIWESLGLSTPKPKKTEVAPEAAAEIVDEHADHDHMH